MLEKEQEGTLSIFTLIWIQSRREGERERDLGRRDFLPGLSACGHTDQFLILRSAGHWVRDCVDQDVPSCFISCNAFIAATEPKLLFAFFLPFVPSLPEMVRTRGRMESVYPC